MKAPRTYFSTQLRTGPTAVRRRLRTDDGARRCACAQAAEGGRWGEALRAAVLRRMWMRIAAPPVLTGRGPRLWRGMEGF